MQFCILGKNKNIVLTLRLSDRMAASAISEMKKERENTSGTYGLVLASKKDDNKKRIRGETLKNVFPEI